MMNELGGGTENCPPRWLREYGPGNLYLQSEIKVQRTSSSLPPRPGVVKTVSHLYTDARTDAVPARPSTPERSI